MIHAKEAEKQREAAAVKLVEPDLNELDSLPSYCPSAHNQNDDQPNVAPDLPSYSPDLMMMDQM